MSNRVCNFSDLVQRVTANCLLHPLGSNRFDRDQVLSPDRPGESEDDPEEEEEEEVILSEYESGEAEEIGGGEVDNKGRASLEGHKCKIRWKEEKEREMEAAVALMGQVFEAASAMKRAYVDLQEAHCPWDPAKMRTADEAVVAELRRIGLLRERFRRGFAGGAGSRGRAGLGGAAMREAVAPYEAAVDELKREVKAKEMEIESLRERLKSAAGAGAGGRKGRSHSKRKVSCSQSQVPLSPSPELFEATMSLVRETSKSFAGLLHSLMRSAHWDNSAAVRSIESAATSGTLTPTASFASSSPTGPHHARCALESYVTRKLFQGFDHETFYMDGTLLSLLNPDHFRRDCFSKYRDMKSMDPTELLGVTPTCHFGVFCAKKFLSIMHPKMEESLFGDLDHRRRVSAGDHPRTAFYAEFLAVAKAVWLLHLLAFSLDPAPSHFEATRGAEFHPVYMESVVQFPSGKVPPGQVVGLPVSPGFKLGSGSVIKARVYLVNRI